MDGKRLAAVFVLQRSELQTLLEPPNPFGAWGQAVRRVRRCDSGRRGCSRLCFKHAGCLLGTNRTVERTVGDDGAVLSIGDGYAWQRAVGRTAADRGVIRRIVDAAVTRT